MNNKSPLTVPDYWDCGCMENYIHPKSLMKCSKCGCHQDEMPDARKDEVEKLISTHYREEPAGAYDSLLNHLESAVEILAQYGPAMHPRERIPGGRKGNKTLYGCLPACFPPDWSLFGSVEYNACSEDTLEEEVTPLYEDQAHLAQFWTVYGRHTVENGYKLVAITDVTTKKMAVQLCERFTEQISKAALCGGTTPVPGSLSELLSG